MSFVDSKCVAQLLHKLARDKCSDDEFLTAFNELYKDGKKQLYYKIFEEFSNIQGDTCEDLMRALSHLDDILKTHSANETTALHKLFSYLKDKEFTLAQAEELKELKDKDDKNAQTLAKVAEEINQAHAKIGQAHVKINQAHDKIDKSRTEYVAILGIFAAIIMAFAGGFGLNAKFFETIKAENFNLYLCAFTLGSFGLFNLIALLLYFCIKPRRGFVAFWGVVNAALISAGIYFYTHIN